MTRLTRYLMILTAGVLLASPQAQAQRPQERERPEIVLVRLVLKPQGFNPSEITVTEGLVRIEVLNRVGFPELPMLLEREAEELRPKQVLRQEPFERRRPKWAHEMLFEPGTYTVSVEERPNWTSRIVVVPAE